MSYYFEQNSFGYNKMIECVNKSEDSCSKICFNICIFEIESKKCKKDCMAKCLVLSIDKCADMNYKFFKKET